MHVSELVSRGTQVDFQGRRALIRKQVSYGQDMMFFSQGAYCSKKGELTRLLGKVCLNPEPPKARVNTMPERHERGSTDRCLASSSACLSARERAASNSASRNRVFKLLVHKSQRSATRHKS